jgi:hypothetical protein
MIDVLKFALPDDRVVRDVTLTSTKSPHIVAHGLATVAGFSASLYVLALMSVN